MKRLLVLLVATLGYFCTYAQEVKEDSRIPDFIVTPRFDVSQYAPIEGGRKDFDFGNSSLYTFLDGSVGNFSYSLANHWLSSDWASSKALYENAFRSNDVDFIDWLTLSYTVGRFTFTLGKDMLVACTLFVAEQSVWLYAQCEDGGAMSFYAKWLIVDHSFE